MKFITVTLNPSLDQTLVTHYLGIGYHNRTQGARYLDPAGRGVNIARALHQLKAETHAIILLGDDATGRAYKALITEEGFTVTFITVNGPTRTDTIILDTGNDTETHIIEEGAEVTEADLQKVVKPLQELIAVGDIVVYAGSLPNGAPTNVYARLINVAHQAGAQVAVATGGPPLAEALKAQPELVASRRAECEAYFNYPIRVQEDIINCAHKLRKQGAKRALVEVRETGHAILVTEAGEWEVDLYDTIEGTSSGIWDAMLAGFLAGHAKHRPLGKALELGAAAAAYTASQIGSEFGSSTHVKEYIPETDVVPVDQNPQD